MATAKETTALEAPGSAQLEAAYAAILDGTELPGDLTVGGKAADPELVSRQIVERLLAAETFEELFQPQSVPAWRDMMDVPVFVRDVKLNRSTIAGSTGAPVYAVCELERLDNASRVTVTCGGRNVLAQLVKAMEKGWLDRPVKLIGKPTGEGYTALWLQAA